MAVSFSSFVGFNSSLNQSHASRTSWTSIKNNRDIKSSGAINRILSPIKFSKVVRWKVLSNGDSVVTDILQNPENPHTTKDTPFSPSSSISESSNLDQILLNLDIPESPSLPKVSSSLDDENPTVNTKSVLKRSPLTAREKVRAARVLSRYTEPKVANKPVMGSKLIDALKEADKGKKTSGLPEAPTNLLDDSKRGMPKSGLTFDFPGGVDLFFIVFSFVFISTVMFATTYVVWKVGAIHFNEY